MVAAPDVAADGFCGEPHIGKREFIGDNCAPSGCAEFNLGHREIITTR